MSHWAMVASNRQAVLAASPCCVTNAASTCRLRGWRSARLRRSRWRQNVQESRMKSFARALVLGLRYRWTFAASLVCALLVAVLWGGNFGALYPLAEAAFNRETLHSLAERQMAETRAEIGRLEHQIQDLQPGPERNNQARTLRRELAAKRQWLNTQAWLKRHVLDPFLPRDPFRTLALVVAVVVAATFMKSLFFVLHQVLCARLSQRVAMDLRNAFFRHTLNMDLAVFHREGTSELMNRFTADMESLASGINEFFGKLVREPLKMLACLIGAAWISWQLLLFSLLVVPPAAVLIRWLARTLKRANRRAMEEMTQIFSILEESFQGIKVVKAFTMERYERWRFRTVSRNYFLKAMRIARYDSLTRPLTEILGILTISVAMLAGAYLVLNERTHLFGMRMSDGPLSLSALLVFYAMLAGVSDPARKMSEIFSRIQRAAAAGDRIFQLMDRQPEIVDPVRPRALGRHRQDLVFDEVSFHYQAGQPVLEQISLQVRFGETVAVVGPNGCGKTTLVSLIPRFFDPVSGSVRLDGIDLREVRLRDLRRQIGLVTQETLLFDDTVYNNIRYGSPHATRADVIRAAEQAHAHRFIEEKLARGYETVVGPRGSLLSGGQRQRIALARAILRDPPLLILDEATSQIDLESEQLIQKVLERFIRQRTTIIITHRLGTLALADRIVVMDAGRILDIGQHDELIRRCDLYRRLHMLHFRETA